MLALAYLDLYHLNPLEARKMLLQVFQETGQNVSQTAHILSCSRNTVRKFIRRHRQGLPLTDLSRRPHHFPRQTPPAIEQLVVKERRRTGLGPIRLRDLLLQHHHLHLSSYTIRNILHRKGLSHPRRRRKRFRGRSCYSWEKIYPLQHFQIDLKQILDKKSLPLHTYQHLRKAIARGTLPPYQWTASDPYSKTKFLAFSFEKNFSNGRCFFLLIYLWLRSLGISHPLFFQTDWGEEFGGKSLTKLERLQKNFFAPLNIQALRIRKGRWQDNAYVERTHRTDDEEFYVPELAQINNTQELFVRALKYQYTFNTKRAHYGKPNPGLTPKERLKGFRPEMTDHFFLFPPLILDSIALNYPFIDGHDLLAYY